MTNQHPISVPDELLRQWCQQIQSKAQTSEELWRNIANTSAQWAADAELEACCEWLGRYTSDHIQAIYFLRTDRRPKPPSLKEQALAELEEILKNPQSPLRSDTETIRRALEQLND